MLDLKSYSMVSNQGPYLQLNEDSVESDLVNGLFFVIDGFGGANIGDRAVTKIKEDLKKFYSNIGGDPDSTLPHFYSARYSIESNAMINSIYYSHHFLRDENSKKPMSERAGASVLMAALTDNLVSLVGVGNCRAILLRGGNIKEVCSPDNMELVCGDFYDRQFHTMPNSALGLYDDFSFMAKEIRIQADDMVVMMTDGAYSRISDDELKQILTKPVRHNQKIDDIFHLVNSRGNMDNQSVIVLEF